MNYALSLPFSLNYRRFIDKYLFFLIASRKSNLIDHLVCGPKNCKTPQVTEVNFLMPKNLY